MCQASACREPSAAYHPAVLPLQAPDSDGEVGPGRPAYRLGYGECSRSGCPCKAYEQAYNSELCRNCGHPYTEHW